MEGFDGGCDGAGGEEEGAGPDFEGGGGAFGGDGEGGEGAADGEEGGFGAQVVVDEGPGGDGPAVVELPDERAGVVFAPGTFPLAAPETVGGGEAVGLH